MCLAHNAYNQSVPGTRMQIFKRARERILPVAHRKKMKKKLNGHSHLTAEKTPEGHEAVPTSADEMRRLSRLRLALKVGRASFSMQSGPWAVPGYPGTCATFHSPPLSLSFTKQKMSYDLDLAYGRRDASSGSALPHSLPSFFLSLSRALGSPRLHILGHRLIKGSNNF